MFRIFINFRQLGRFFVHVFVTFEHEGTLERKFSGFLRGNEIRERPNWLIDIAKTFNERVQFCRLHTPAIWLEILAKFSNEKNLNWWGKISRGGRREKVCRIRRERDTELRKIKRAPPKGEKLWRNNEVLKNRKKTVSCFWTRSSWRKKHVRLSTMLSKVKIVT